MSVAFLAENLGEMKSAYRATADGFMKQTGHNSGNMAFWKGMSLLVDEPIQLITWTTTKNQLRSDTKAIVIPAANFLNETANLTGLADLIEATDLPCVTVGLGAQSENLKTYPKLGESVVRFMQGVSKRSSFIGIRGEYTREVCNHYGIENVEVLGCPSIFINPRPDLGEVIEAKIEHIDYDNLVVHASCVKHYLTSIERELFRLSENSGRASYIVQRPMEFFKIVLNETLTDADMVYITKCAEFFAPQKTVQQFIEAIRRMTYLPTGIDAWATYVKSFSLAVNTRIHGTIVPLSAEVPAVCITHDTRTQELARRMKVPAITYDEYIKYRYNLRDVVAKTGFSGRSFDTMRSETIGRYQALFDSAGIKLSNHFAPRKAVTQPVELASATLQTTAA